MYAYLYDPVLRQSSFRGFVERLESRLVDFGLSGKIYRLSPLLHLNEIVANEQRRGVKTVVAVGTDRLFHQLLNAPNIQQFVVGFVPLSDKSVVGGLLGIPSEIGAATILSHRIVKPLQLATANAVRFFWDVTIPGIVPGVSVRCDERYTITPMYGDGTITVRNVAHLSAHASKKFVVHIDIRERALTSSRSVFFSQKILLDGIKEGVRVDGQPFVVEKLRIEKLPMTLRVIVGRHRHEALDDVGAPTAARLAEALASAQPSAKPGPAKRVDAGAFVMA